MGTPKIPSTLITLLFVFCFSCSSLIAIAGARAFVAQVTFSGSVLSPVYLASNLSIGTPPQPQKLLISTDAASHTWVKCGAGAPFDQSKSSSFQYATCGRNQQPCYEALRPYGLRGRLAKDTFSLHSTNGSWQGGLARVPGVTFACRNTNLGGLGYGGVASFTARKSGLPAQLGVSKFAYCLASAPGAPTPLFLGEGISYLFSQYPVFINISDFLAKVKLNVDPKAGYFSIGLNNVSVDTVPLNVSSPIQLRISSVEPFTKLSSNVYLSLRWLFRMKAAERGIKPVRAHRPFDTCFNASTIGFSRVGPAVPVIELALAGDAAGKNVGWSVFGFNSIVSVSESVSCWAFLDAGGVGKPSVLGSFQQQRGLFEFDLLNKKLGFSGVLDFYRTTCSNFNF